MIFSFITAAAAAQVTSGFELGAVQFLFIVLLAFAIIGFYRGWQRGLVTLGFYLGVLLILFLNGGQAIATFIFDIVPRVLQVIVGGSAQSNPPPSSSQVLIVQYITLAVGILAGYLVSNRAIPKPPNTPTDRLLGILPSMIGGYALVYYVSNYLIPSTNGNPPQTLFMVDTPNPSTVGSSLAIIFVIVAVVLVAALVVANAKKPGAKK